ncbi:hypothetical protein [Oceanobacter mangrovi]|uniref:hypothetical protein n=1 Tax=Oceanobacter mangrovi TaxID=2862510 RepID=UPI001C8D6B8E|nr:hypothetical protein [Oceanobacter mangrovi]
MTRVTHAEFLRLENRKAQIKSKLDNNRHQLDILSSEQLIQVWQDKVGPAVAQTVLPALKESTNYVAPTLDSITLGRVASDLGILGRIQTKMVQGKQYVIIKGLAGRRSLIQGTRYLASNAKMVELALTKEGVNKSIVSGARITIYLVVPLNVVKYILDDEATLGLLVGETATDLVKIGIGAIVSSLAVSGAIAVAASAGVSMFALGPLAIAVIVGLVAGAILNSIDKQYNITDSLVSKLSSISEKLRNIDNNGRNIINKFNEKIEDCHDNFWDYGVQCF